MNHRAQLVVVAVFALLVGLGVGHYAGARRGILSMPSPQMPTSQPAAMNGMDHSMHQTPTEMAAAPTSSSTMDMAGMMYGMMMGLQGKTGDDFDEAFLDEMIIHHQGAVDMAKAVLTSSNRTELKAFANEIMSAQTREIEQMQAWRSQWFGK